MIADSEYYSFGSLRFSVWQRCLHLIGFLTEALLPVWVVGSSLFIIPLGNLLLRTPPPEEPLKHRLTILSVRGAGGKFLPWVSDWARRSPGFLQTLGLTGFCNGAKSLALEISCNRQLEVWSQYFLAREQLSASLEMEILNLNIHTQNSAGILKPAQNWYSVVFSDTEKWLLIFFGDLQNL